MSDQFTEAGQVPTPKTPDETTEAERRAADQEADQARRDAEADNTGDDED